MRDLLDWTANAGFSDFAKQFNLDYSSAHEFRQRHTLAALNGLTSAIAKALRR